MVKQNDVLIVGFSNATTEGITLHFNKKTSLKTGNVASDKFWVSWDKIGQALVDNYSDSNDVVELNRMRQEQGFPVI